METTNRFEWRVLNPEANPKDQYHILTVDGQDEAILSWLGDFVERPDQYN